MTATPTEDPLEEFEPLDFEDTETQDDEPEGTPA